MSSLFDNISYPELKQKVPAYKSHLTRVKSRLDGALGKQNVEKVKSLAIEANQKIDTLFSLIESLEVAVISAEVDQEAEALYISSLSDDVVRSETELQAVVCDFLKPYESHAGDDEAVISQPSKQQHSPVVKLANISPPSWNGAIADFSTWQRLFKKIMNQAQVTDSDIQLTWLLKEGIMPHKYTIQIKDCKSIDSAWARLEDAIPLAVQRHEVLQQFQQIKPLKPGRSAAELRDLAHGISMFSSRMVDLNLDVDVKSVGFLNDLYTKLDSDTALRYRSQLNMAIKCGTVIEDSLDEIALFLRSEATTLELANNLSISSPNSNHISEKSAGHSPSSNRSVHAVKVESAGYQNSAGGGGEKPHSCKLGCPSLHRLLDCNVYMGMTSDKRKQFISKERRCFLCLGSKHTAVECSKASGEKNCKVCLQSNHHWTLCPRSVIKSDLPLDPEAAPFLTLNTKPPATVHSFKSSSPDIDLAPIVMVEVKSASGDWVPAVTFMDGGSNHTLVKKSFAYPLQLTEKGRYTLQFGVAGGKVHEELAQDFDLEIRPLGADKSFHISATAINKPCSTNAPVVPEELFHVHDHLKEHQNQIYTAGGPIDLLIGRDYAPLIHSSETIRSSVHPYNNPAVTFTPLGPYLFGGMDTCSSSSGINNSKFRHIHHLVKLDYISHEADLAIKDFFYGELLGVKPSTLCVCSENEVKESAFIKHVRATTRIEDKHVYMSMPWKSGFPEKLPNNYQQATLKMQVREKQMVKEGKLDIYNNEIKDLVDRGVVRKLSSEEAKSAPYEPGWFLNHRIVERPDKSSTKLRLVWDAAAKFKGVCLNDGLYKGPNYTNNLVSVFLRWRAYKVAVCGDISKMFNMFLMNQQDQIYHRFMWRDGVTNAPPQIYQWLTLLFGDTPSPDLASYGLHLLADLHADTHPVGSLALKEKTYVDDVGDSEDVKFSQVTSLPITEEVDEILSAGNLKIKVWNSNHPNVDQNPQDRITDFLGHEWDKTDDLISLKTRDFDVDMDKFNKRSALGLVMKLWDPIGLLLPVTMRYRIDLQQLWEHGYSWDEDLPPDIKELWASHSKVMEEIQNLSFERCLKPDDAIDEPQLHGCSDGGNLGFGACIFLRWPTETGFKVTFVSSKAYVAPLKHKTTPELELLAAMVVCRLMSVAETSLPYKITSKKFWIDSEVVIYWLTNLSSRFKPFIASRIQEFQDTHTNYLEEIKYIPSELNPADKLTKPIELKNLSLFHDGPYFLSQPESSWPEICGEAPEIENMNAEFLKEKPKPQIKKYKRVKKSINHIADLSDVEGVIASNISSFQSWPSMLQAIDFLKRSLSTRTFLCPLINLSNPAETLEHARFTLFKIAQESSFKDIDESRKRLFKLDLQKSDDGIIRVGGRLSRSQLPEFIKHPVVLPKESAITVALLTHYHVKFKHQGYRVVQSNLSQEGILVAGGKDILKSIADKCIFCRIRRRKLLQQQMAVLPAFRVDPEKAPFSSVAMDFFGNLRVKLTRNICVDATVLINTCTTSRCIHLELCMMQDTDSFMRAWRRFVSIRGIHPTLGVADAAKCFRQGDPIRSWIESWDKHLVEQELAANGTSFHWETNTPTASHMNGVVESLIRSVRKALDASIRNYSTTALTYEQWETVLREVTYLVNSRPIYPDGDPSEGNCITGNSLLHPYGQPTVHQISQDLSGIDLLSTLKVVQQKVNIFWSTWLKHMPPQLLFRNKWYHSRANLEVGDFVINLENGFKGVAPRGTWKKAIVHECHPSKDGLVRSVTIRDSAGNLYKRPIHKLCLIATHHELENGFQ